MKQTLVFILIIFILIAIIGGLAYYFLSYQKENLIEKNVEEQEEMKEVEEIDKEIQKTNEHETQEEKEEEGEENNKAINLANPASVFCQEKGGTSENVSFEKGQNALCVFDDESICWEWDLFERKCEKGQLKKEIIKQGEGRKADKKDTITVHYIGFLEDGTKFDSSRDIDTPFVFNLGVGQVIPGWDQGILGTKKGEKIKLTIGPELAYGDAGAGGIILPKATLIFEVEILEIQ